MKRFLLKDDFEPTAPPMKQQKVISSDVLYKIDLGRGEKPGEEYAYNLQTRNQHPNDYRITFDEGPHKYYVDGKVVGISVSGINDSHVPHFNQELVLKRMFGRAKHDSEGVLRIPAVNPAKPVNYEGCSREDVLDRWDEARDDGTYLHRCIQLYYESFTKGEYDRMTSKEDRRKRLFGVHGEDGIPKKYHSALNQFLQIDTELREDSWRIYRVEWNIFHKKYDLAGGLDALFVRDSPGGFEYRIVDWKYTDKPLKKPDEAPYYPLEKSKNSRYFKYSLQLNDYGFILRDKDGGYNLNVTHYTIAQLYPDSNQGTLHPVENMQAEVKSMLDIRNYAREVESCTMENITGKKRGYEGEDLNRLPAFWHPKEPHPCFYVHPTEEELEAL